MSRWPLAQLRHIARFEYGDSLSSDVRAEGSVKVFGSNGPVGVHNRANTGAPAIVIGRKGSYGQINYSAEPVFAIDTTYFVDPTTTSNDIRWLYYAMGTAGLTTLGQDVGVPGLNRDLAYRQRVPLPSLVEQRAIADYLDAVTARIDALIAKKQQLIYLLDERRRSHIDRLLWRGRVARLKFVADVVPGYAFPSGDFSPDASGPLLLRGINVGVNELTWSDSVHLQGDEPPHARYVLADGDVVVGMDRPFISKGTRVARVEPADAGALLVQRVCRLRPIGSVSAVLVAAISSRRFRAYVEADLTGVSVPHLSDEQIGDFEVPAELSDSGISAIEEAMHESGQIEALLKSQMQLLVEHRQAQISAAVMGQFPVLGGSQVNPPAAAG